MDHVRKNKLSTKVKEISEWDLTLETHLPTKSHDFFIKLLTLETPYTQIKLVNLPAHPKEVIIMYLLLMLTMKTLFWPDH